MPRTGARRTPEPRLPKTLNQGTARRILEQNGWKKEQGGKHVIKMTKPGHRPITLPAHHRQEYSVGLTRSILKAAGLLSDGKQEGGDGG